MLLAAGLGTRLQPLTERRPKPIVPVANRPLAAFAMDVLCRAGVTQIVANTHPMPHLVTAELQAHRPAGVDLAFSHEPVLLGTGGGLKRAWPLFRRPDQPVIVMNGDTLFAVDLDVAVRAQMETGAVATMILRRTAEPDRFGAVGIDHEGWVRSLPGLPESPHIDERLMFTGVHVLSPSAHADLPASGCIIRHTYHEWLRRGAGVRAIIDPSPWADLGRITDYHRVNLELASGSLSWPGIQPHDGNLISAEIIEHDSTEGATKAPPRIQRSVVGDRARLDEGVTLEECVVWPGTRVTTSARRAVLTPHHRIELSLDP